MIRSVLSVLLMALCLSLTGCKGGGGKSVSYSTTPSYGSSYGSSSSPFTVTKT